MKHGVGSMKLRGCFFSTGTGDGIYSFKYLSILEQNMDTSDRLKILPSSIMKTHSTNPSQQGSSFRKILERSSESPTLNAIKNLQSDLKRAVHRRSSCNLIGMKEEWVKLANPEAGSKKDQTEQCTSSKKYFNNVLAKGCVLFLA